VAIVGYGLAGSEFHAPLIAEVPDLEVRSVVTAHPERRRRAAADFPGARLLGSADELWDDHAGVDLVVLATPNHLHAPQAITALERGMAVVVDKPMALSTAEATAMMEAEQRSGRALSVFQNRRWFGDSLVLRETLESGRLGGLLRLEGRFERHRPALRPGAWREETASEMGGGLLLDLGSHLIDLVLVLLGMPESVYAEIDRVREGAVADDDCFVSLSFAGGARAHLWVSNLTPAPGPRWRAWGRAAALEIWDPEDGHPRALLTAGGEPAGREVPVPEARPAEFYSRMAAAVRGEGSPPVGAAEGRNVLAIIEAARRSASAGAAVRPERWGTPTPPG
jgi:scyllo-inositol 2-dehydrogenase (NADP+)